MKFDENGWHYEVAKVLPKHKGEVALITDLCIGPLEEDILGIDSENRPYESHKWLENDLYEDENYCKNITVEELISKIEKKREFFREGQKDAEVLACDKIITWLQKEFPEDK